jgi:hypothetical protein
VLLSARQMHHACLHNGANRVCFAPTPGTALPLLWKHILPAVILSPSPPPTAIPPPLAVRVAKRELKLECDYRYELQSQQRFKQLISSDPYTLEVGAVLGTYVLRT